MGNNDDEIRRRREQNAKDEAEIQRMRKQHLEEQTKIERQNREALAAFEKGRQQAAKQGKTPPKPPRLKAVPPPPKKKSSSGCGILALAMIAGAGGAIAVLVEAVSRIV